jgi:transcriptional regulator with XRE-family HTH domain
MNPSSQPDGIQTQEKRKRGRPRVDPKLGPSRRAARPAKGLFPGVCRTALAAQLGVHRVSITRILSGRARGSSELLERMAAGVKTPKTELLQILASLFPTLYKS